MKTIHMGIGFTTGRKNFRKVLNAHMKAWKMDYKLHREDVKLSLHLFVAYDVEYLKTQSTDYTNLSQDTVDSFDDIVFLGIKNSSTSLERLKQNDEFSAEELKSVFGAGYAGKRNAILFAAIENQMDYLLYLDDDEYPVAVSNNHGFCLWSGQRLLSEHLQTIANADYTNGHHCGYISPIPQIEFNETLREQDFRVFIEAVSNDIVNWDKIKKLMDSGGVTYASTNILIEKQVEDVLEIGGCKFISGANLCVNLTHPKRTFPFYNPPGARGEDTFLSTMLHDRIVRKIPCYAFHDGFSTYHDLLEGVLPIKLSPVKATSPALVTRFLNACIGWVRYKPLLTYITKPDRFELEMTEMEQALSITLPKLAKYFQNERFMLVLPELQKYRKNVKKHFQQFALTQDVWNRIVSHIENSNQGEECSVPTDL